MKRSEPGDGAASYPAISPGEAQALRCVIAEQAETIRDLRHRLDAEAEERRRLMALLTGPARVSWWRRWFR
jgi:hypothetical protein